LFIFGHAGLTIAAARALDRDVDLRWAAVLALGPDLLDKPLSRLIPELVNHNTRSFGHTLLFSVLILTAALIWKRRFKPALVLWACYAGHFVLDGMWRNTNPAILFWPALGGFPPNIRGPRLSWYMAAMVAGELAGLAVIHRMGLFDRRRLAAFLKTGRVDG
jgi:inner membrane protein